MTTERKHDLYSPSRLPFLDKCPGWISDGAPGEAAERGTRIGERLAQWFMGNLAGEPMDILEGAVPEDTEALENGARMLEEIASIHPEMQWAAEARADTGIPDCGGWIDLLGVDDFMGEAVVVELKTGQSHREPAQSNLQVQAYVLGCMRESYYPVTAYLVECDLDFYTAYDYREGSASTLTQTVSSIVSRAQKPLERDLSPGEYCRYCARHTQCPAVVESPTTALEAIGGGQEVVLSPEDYAKALTPSDLSDTLKQVLPVMKLAEGYVGALKAQAMKIFEAGGEIPDFDVKHTSGARSWLDEQQAADELADAYPDHIKVLLGLVSPAQVEKRLGKECKPLVARLTKAGKRSSLVQIEEKEDGLS